MQKTITTSGSEVTSRGVRFRLRRVVGAGVGMLLAFAGGTSRLGAQTSTSSPLVIADFNQDGIPDVLLLLQGGGSTFATVSLGSVPYGKFSGVSKPVSLPSNCSYFRSNSPMVGDFNGDGYPDLAFLCSAPESSNSSIVILLGKGDGTFDSGRSVQVAGSPDLVVGDFNHDGFLDIVTVGRVSNANATTGILFYAGSGDGSLQTPVLSAFPASTTSQASLAVDVNQDGYPDLVVPDFFNAAGATLKVYGNNRDGTFGVPGSGTITPNVTLNVGTYPTSYDQTIVTGNFFGSGLPDLAVPDEGSTQGVFLLQNTSTATTYSFATPTKVGFPGLRSARAASFIGQLSDLLVFDGTKLTVLANDGKGGFAPSFANLSVANTSYRYSAADANGDGHADIYVAVDNNQANYLDALGGALSQPATITVNLLSGSATATSAPFPLGPGVKAFSAAWPGNVNLYGASANGSQTVTGLPSLAALLSNRNPALVGDAITFTTSVAPATPGTAVPTGSVIFSDGTKVLGGGSLDPNGTATFTTSALAAGSHAIQTAYSGDNVYSPSLSNTVTQQVNQPVQIVPTVNWVNPAPIGYGTPLSAKQLNAEIVDVNGNLLPGNYVYTPPLGTVLNPGTQILMVTFTPTNTKTYSGATGSVPIVVNQATPVIAWTTPASLPYGAPLSVLQLNASATGIGGAALPGTFVYTPAAGTVLSAGQQSLTVLFTPTDSNYTAAGARVPLVVTQARSLLTFQPANLVFGTPLGTAQLNAVATRADGTALPGAFVYTPAAGTSLPVGQQTLNVVFTPTDPNYATTSASAVITVAQGVVSIAWSAPSAIIFGTPLTAAQLNATAPSGGDGGQLQGTFVYTPAAGTVLPAGAQTLKVVFTPTNANLQAASASVPLTVTQATPILSWSTPANIVYGTALSAAQLNATATGVGGASLPGTFTYTPVVGTVLLPGVQTLGVFFTPTSPDYSAAKASVVFTVTTGVFTITWPSPASLVYGTPLGATQLNATTSGAGGAVVPGAFVYTPAAGTILNAGTQTLGVVFTPTDPNIAPASSTVQILVKPATPSITWPTPAAIAYGTPLSGTQLNATASGVGGTALPGTFTYTPAAGSIAAPGPQTLSVAFNPTDGKNYSSASSSVVVTVTDLVLTSFTPTTAKIGSGDTIITLTGSGFVATTVAQANGTALGTTFVNSTTLTAVVPASFFVKPGTVQITLFNPVTKTATPAQPLTIAAPPVGVTVTGPPTTPPGTQPTVSLTITNPYPVDLTAAFTLSFAGSGPSAIDDPAVQFAAGGRSYTFVIPANTTAVPNIQLQAGTVAGTITILLHLLAGGADVTPGTVTPVIIVVPGTTPSISATAATRTSGLFTVVLHGFSNTREVTKATFHFVAAPGAKVTTPDITADVAGLFANWFGSQASQQFGSTFTYTQEFTVSDDPKNIGSVEVTLTNSVGTSTSQTAQ